MELKHLKTFLVVAKELSFNKSAEILNYAQSSVTSHIQSLENELRVPLFERLGKKVILTEEGRRLLLLSEKILAMVEETKELVSGCEVPTGTLTIGAHESQCTYRLPPILHKFRVLYPKVHLIFRPIVSDRNLHDLLGQGILDVAFMFGLPISPEGLSVEPLVKENILILAHPEHSLTQLEQVTACDLGGETILTTEEGCPYRHTFEQSIIAAGVRTAAKIEFSSIESIKQCVIAGLGIAALPEITVRKEIAQGQISVLNWNGPEFPIMTQLAWHKDKRMTLALKAFLELTRKVFFKT